MSALAGAPAVWGSGWSAAARTHVGLRRQNNQDAFVCEPARGLLAVIDGMGGAAAGEVAAAITREALLQGAEPKPAIAEANRAILERGQRHPQEQGMGCVVTAVRLGAAEIRLAHVGDTRAYLSSRVGFEQLTVDHTATAELRERLGMTAEQARLLPGAHQVTRDVGGLRPEEAEALIDEHVVPVEIGDVLLLCSDGLHDLVREPELARILSSSSSATAVAVAADHLLQLALERGGHDNITLIVARREDPPVPLPLPLPLTTPPPPPQGTSGSGREGGRLLRGCVAMGASLLLALLGFGIGWRMDRTTEVAEAEGAGEGVVVAVQSGEAQVRPGPAGLEGVLSPSAPGPVTVTVLGPLEGAGWARTTVQAGASVTVRAAEVQFPAQAHWQVVLEAGATLTLRQGVIRAADLLWEVDAAPGAHLVLEDSILEVGRLKVRASSASEAENVVVVRGPPLVLRGEPGEVERIFGAAEGEGMGRDRTAD